MKLYTAAVVAEWLDISERRVRQLRDQKVLEEARPKLYRVEGGSYYQPRAHATGALVGSRLSR